MKKRMMMFQLMALMSAGPAPAADGVIRRLVWQVETSDPVDRNWALTYGETVDFEVQYLDHRRPMDLTGGSVVLHARTPGMDMGLSYQATGSVMSAQGWVTVRVAVDALLPAGLSAASYRIAVTQGGGTNLLAAAGTFRLSGSGAGIAGAALPTPVAMEIREEMAAGTNQVMALLGPRITTLEAGTNDWRAAYSWGDHALAGYLLPAALAPYATTQQVAAAVAAIPRDRITTQDGSQWIDATGGVWRVTTVTVPDTSRLMIWHNIPGAPWPDAFVIDPFDPSSGYNEFVGFRWFLNLSSAGSVSSSYVMDYETGDMWSAVFDSDPLDYPVTLEKVDESSGMIVEYATSTIVITSRVDGVAWQSSISAATNALVQTHLLGSNAWMIVSNDVLRIWQLSPTNSLQTNLLWQSGDAFPPAATQTLWSAILQLTSDLAETSPKAWGEHAPDGSANPDPAYMTFLSAPATVFASGAQWSTYGTYAVLTATGTVAFASGGDGQFRIGPNSTNWFGYLQGGSVTVGAVPDSLTVTGGGQTGGYAEIVYPYAGGDFPALWFTPSLALDFTEAGGAVWIDNLDGTATATAPAESAAGFWYATTTSVIDNYFTSTMPARLDGGIVGATNALPVVYDSVITISAGGKNYRIPAQEVE